MSVFASRPGADRLAVIGMRSQADTLWHALRVTARRLATKS